MQPAITRLKNRRPFVSLYGDDATQVDRWERLIERFTSCFGERELRFFSAPGRTELGGNHTDHNNGIVLAAAVDLDSLAVASPNDTHVVTVHSEGYESPFVVDLQDLQPVDAEAGTTAALIRGIAARLNELGHETGGFDATVTSSVIVGSGLSSSASIEVLIGAIFSALFNGGKINSVNIAMAGQYAENHFFGKPSGLMDQIACSVGGMVLIDFGVPDQPVIKEITSELSSDHSLIVVNTGGSHADLTEDYASIPREMRSVAEALGKRFAREIDIDEFWANIRRLRGEVGDRPILRVMHFLHENKRVIRQAGALEAKLFDDFLRLVRESGESSCKWLQNCHSPNSIEDQGIMLALAVTEDFLRQHGAGACRVHGGGFAGTIQVWLRTDSVDDYRELMDGMFGPNSVLRLNIRNMGATEI